MPFKFNQFPKLQITTVLLIFFQLFSSCQQQKENYVVGENFMVKDFMKDSLPILLVGNTAFDKFSHKTEFPYFIKITSKYKVKGESMYPTAREIYRLDSLETATESMLKDAGIQEHYVFRDTHNGVRNFYLVTNDKDAAQKAMDKFQKNSISSPFQYTIITDKKWSIYETAKKVLNQQ
jgi:hypothetical protein